MAGTWYSHRAQDTGRDPCRGRPRQGRGLGLPWLPGSAYIFFYCLPLHTASLLHRKIVFFASGVLLIGRQQLRTSVLATAPATTRTRRRGLHDSLSRTRWPSNVRPSATNSSAARRSSKSWLILVLLKGLLALPFPQSFAIIDSNLSPSQSSFGPSYMQSL